jgi:hypothetical protein
MEFSQLQRENFLQLKNAPRGAAIIENSIHLHAQLASKVARVKKLKFATCAASFALR